MGLKRGIIQIVIGIVVIIIAVAISAHTMESNSSKYVIWTGGFIVGLIFILKGIYNSIKGTVNAIRRK